MWGVIIVVTSTAFWLGKESEGSSSNVSDSIQLTEKNAELKITVVKLKNQRDSVIASNEIQNMNQKSRIGQLTELIDSLYVMMDRLPVYICPGSSNRFHFQSNCRGLNSCNSPIQKVTLAAAIADKRTICLHED